MQTKLLVLTAIIGMILNGKMAHSQTPTNMNETRKIEVTGNAEMKVIPDEIFVVITIQEYTENKKKTDINEVRKNFLAACTKAGIAKENISIQGMNGYNNSGWYWQRKKEDS